MSEEELPPSSEIPAIKQMKCVSVLGGTGEVGLELVDALTKEENVEEIRLFSRRSITDTRIAGNAKIKEFVNPELNEVTVAGDDVKEALVGSDAVISTMGLGQPSKATCEELERVDYTLPLEFLKTARAAGVPTAAIMTAAGADANASIWIRSSIAGGGLYVSLKGRLEDDTEALHFPNLLIFQPAGIHKNVNTGVIMNGLLSLIGGWFSGKMTTLTKFELGQAIATITAKSFTEHPVPPNEQLSKPGRSTYTADIMKASVVELIKDEKE